MLESYSIPHGKPYVSAHAAEPGDLPMMLEPSLTGNAFLIAILFNAALSSRSIVLHWQIASENFDVDFSNGRAHA